MMSDRMSSLYCHQRKHYAQNQKVAEYKGCQEILLPFALQEKQVEWIGCQQREIFMPPRQKADFQQTAEQMQAIAGKRWL